MERLEEELRADQLKLLPSARARLDLARGTGDERNAAAYVEDLQKAAEGTEDAAQRHLPFAS